MLNPDQVPPAGPTYIYIYIYIRGKEKKRKEKEGVSYYAQQGKQIQQPQYPNYVNATGITTYNIQINETTF